MTNIEVNKLRQELMKMTRHGKLYKVLKEELTSLGYWKNKPRGCKGNAQHFRGKEDW